MASIYLVLRHQEGKLNLGHQVLHHERAGSYPGVGGLGHDARCHCLVVEGKTYATRDGADTRVSELEAENPNDVCFSLEVSSPE